MPHSLCVSVLHRKMHNDEKKQNNNQIDRSQPQLNLFKTDISHYNQNIKFKIYLNYYHCLFFLGSLLCFIHFRQIQEINHFMLPDYLADGKRNIANTRQQYGQLNATEKNEQQIK